MAARLVVLVSGAGTTLQSLLDASADEAFGAKVIAVGSDRLGIEGLARAEKAGVPTFTLRLADYPSRAAWDRAMTSACAAYSPDLVVSAGFMKLAGPDFLAAFGGRFINSHPALLPAFPGAHGVRDALDYGVKVTGVTVHFVDEGTDTGPIIAQMPVPVLDDDTVETLRARILSHEHALYPRVLAALAEGRVTRVGRRVHVRP